MAGIDFTDLDNLKIKQGDQGGFAVFAETYGEGEQLITAFSDHNLMMNWLHSQFESWIKARIEDNANG